MPNFKTYAANRIFFILIINVIARNVPVTYAIKKPCNHLVNVSKLQNDFYVLRHGQSKANQVKIISSHPDIATKTHGLSDVGKRQAESAGTDLVNIFLRGRFCSDCHTSPSRSCKKSDFEYDGIIILSSDYLRAVETAGYVARSFRYRNMQINSGIDGEEKTDDHVIIERRLRERWFGTYDGNSDDNYKEVWKDDADDPSHTNQGVESVDSVMNRTTKCVLDWDSKVSNHLIILVAHGDVLQICQTAFAMMDGSKHRTLEHLDTAKPRQMNLLR